MWRRYIGLVMVLSCCGCGKDEGPLGIPGFGCGELPYIALCRDRWRWASSPVQSTTGDRRASTLRVPVAFYNPTGEVRLGHLDPLLPPPHRK